MAEDDGGGKAGNLVSLVPVDDVAGDQLLAFVEQWVADRRAHRESEGAVVALAIVTVHADGCPGRTVACTERDYLSLVGAVAKLQATMVSED